MYLHLQHSSIYLAPALAIAVLTFQFKTSFLFEWMQVVVPNKSIRVTTATALHCWGLECEKEKN